MQDESRRSNKDRSATMRAALLTAAREMFARDGFAATGTPEIVARAQVTRGALYHHFADKTALFDAVIAAEAEAVAASVRNKDYTGLTADMALLRGGDAFLEAMQVTGRTRLLLREAPTVLGLVRMAQIDAAAGGSTLAEGLRHSLPPDSPVGALAALLSAAYDRAALAIDEGEDPQGWREALARLVRGAINDAKTNHA